MHRGRVPPALADRAISVQQAARRPVERAPLLAALLRRLETRYRSLFEDDGRAVRAAFEARLDRLGQPVALRTTDTGRPVRGIVRGIDDTGALRLETNGAVRAFHAGEVTSRF